jgi:hypothetical protein
VYASDGKLIRPTGTEQWVYLGSAINLNYDGEGMPFPVDVMTTVLMEPSAFRAFREDGVFPEGTMTALFGYALGSDAAPARGGQFPQTWLAFEMSVKDSSHGSPAWAYYSFDTIDAETAAAQPPATCHDCHAEHAGNDNVFVQFYPVLR